MFCVNCGANLSEGARFCPKCGSAVGTGQGGQAGVPNQYAGVPQQNVQPHRPAQVQQPGLQQNAQQQQRQVPAQRHTQQQYGQQQRQNAQPWRSAQSAASRGAQQAGAAFQQRVNEAAQSENGQRISEALHAAFKAPVLPDTDKPLTYYKFIVWFALYAQTLMSAYYAAQMFTGASLLGDLGSMAGSAGGFVSSFSFMTVVLGLGFVCLGVYCIYVRGRLVLFKRDAPKEYLRRIPLALVIIAVVVLPMLFQTVSALGSYGGYVIRATLPTLLLDGGAVALEWYLEKLYLERRSELFVN